MRVLLPLIALAVLLAGCGNKGPLTLPKPKPGSQKPAPPPAAPPAVPPAPQENGMKPAAGQDDKKPADDPKRQNPDSGTLNPERGTEPQ